MQKRIIKLMKRREFFKAIVVGTSLYSCLRPSVKVVTAEGVVTRVDTSGFKESAELVLDDSVPGRLGYVTYPEGAWKNTEVGQETFFRAINNSGKDIREGSMVIFDGVSEDNFPMIKMCVSEDVIYDGQVVEDIPDGAQGYVLYSLSLSA